MRDFRELTSPSLEVEEDLRVEISASNIPRVDSAGYQSKVRGENYCCQILTRFVELLSQLFDFSMALFHRAFQHLDFRLVAAHCIFELDLQSELVRLELIVFVRLSGDGLKKLVHEVNRRRLSEC